MRLAAVLFDVDGTLIESEEIHRQAFQRCVSGIRCLVALGPRAV